jgi:hypothetical protein
MNIKTSELQGAALDWAVAKCVGHRMAENHGAYIRIHLPDPKQSGYTLAFCPSTDWAQGGPIIEREHVQVSPSRNWLTTQSMLRWGCVRIDHKGDANHFQQGPTPLIAAMRCYVASKLGDTVDVPDELCVSAE